jgi:hypothetical protein
MSSASRNRSEDRGPPRETSSSHGPSSNGGGSIGGSSTGGGSNNGGTGSMAASNGRDGHHHNHQAQHHGGGGAGSSNHNLKEHSRHQSSAPREAFFSHFLRNSPAAKAADMIGKGLFGKGGWGGNAGGAPDKEPTVADEDYEIKVINLPLVEQTRKTRISPRLETSRDKTEFWMPALAWRAIDYLNYKGSDVEGLYRVPGSGQQVKRWQRRFDEGACVGGGSVFEAGSRRIVLTLCRIRRRPL